MDNAVFRLVTHDHKLTLAPLTVCFMLWLDPQGNYSIYETVRLCGMDYRRDGSYGVQQQTVPRASLK